MPNNEEAHNNEQEHDNEDDVIFRPYIRTRDGRILWAKDYGHKAWPIRRKK